MDFHWDASADLEDLIYENQDYPPASGNHIPSKRPHRRVWFFSAQRLLSRIKDPSPGEFGRRGN